MKHNASVWMHILLHSRLNYIDNFALFNPIVHDNHMRHMVYGMFQEELHDTAVGIPEEDTIIGLSYLSHRKMFAVLIYHVFHWFYALFIAQIDRNIVVFGVFTTLYKP